MSDELPARLLAYLQGALSPEVTFAEPSVELTGGFDTTILAFRLERAPPSHLVPLVLRLIRSPNRAFKVVRERATQDAVANAGFPAPRVLMSSTGSSDLGAPFLIMERLPGQNMWDNIFGPAGKFTRLFRLTKNLAETHTRLHALDPHPFLEALAAAGLDTDDFTLAGEVRSIANRIDTANLSGLKPGAAWLSANVPAPADRLAICHGDFHALNVVMDGDAVSGVIDWSQAIVADPAYDVACTAVVMRFGPGDLSGVFGWIFDRIRPLPIRRYLGAYRAQNKLDMRNFRYYECVRVLSALTFAGELATGARNPWGDARTAGTLARYFKQHTSVEVSPLRNLWRRFGRLCPYTNAGTAAMRRRPSSTRSSGSVSDKRT